MMLRLLPLLALFVLLFTRDLPAAEQQAVAIVNGEPILLESVERELMRIHMMSTPDAETHRRDFDLDRLIQKMINDRLLAQEARAIGLDEDQQFVSRVRAFRDRLAYRVLVAELLPDTFTVSDAELQSAYAHYLQRFELRLLAVADSMLMVQLAESLRAGESFEQLAGTHSVGRFKEHQGYTGLHALYALPEEIHGALLASAPGTLIGPQPLYRLQTLFRVENRLGPDPAIPVDSVRGMLDAFILAEKREGARRALIDRFRTEIAVVVDSALADSLLVRMQTGESPGTGRVIAVGGSRGVSETEMRGKYIHQTVGKTSRNPREDLFKVMDEQIGMLVLEEAAVRSGYGERDVVVHPTKDYADSMLVLAYLEDVLSARVKIADAEVAAYYDSTRERFRDPSVYRIATLTRMEQDQAAADRELLVAGTDFAWLARRNSIDEVREKGGERPEVNGEQLGPALVGVLDSLRLGDISRPLKVDNGYMLIKLLDRREGPIRPLERVAENIRYHLERARELQEIELTIQTLRRNADIELREDMIKNLQITGPEE